MMDKSLITRFTLIVGTVWLLSILGLVITLFIATNSFKGVVQNTSFGNSQIFLITLIGTVVIGSIAYGLGIINFIYRLVKNSGYKNIFVFFIKFFLILTFFPFYLLILIFRPKKIISLLKSLKIKRPGFAFKKISAYKSIVGFCLITSIFSIWIGGYFVVGFTIASQLKLLAEPISVSGTGSMYPTFAKGQGKSLQEQAKEIVGAPGMFPYPNGITIGGIKLFSYQLSRGDIVVLINDKTKELSQKLYGNPSGWVKRIIGLPGDSIELKNGIVYLNDQPLKESYTAKARSTFAEAFLSECKKVTIPTDSVFVMGDNRKGSGDSREIGFINIKDINHVLPIKSQKNVLDKYWRDTSKDFDDSSKIKMDKQQYLDLLNEKRKEANVQLLKYQPKLEKSATKRGEVILKYDDFSFEATRSGYTMNKAMADSGYYNITYGEAPRPGYYDAEELIENQFEFPETKKFLLNNDYQELGIAEVEGQLNGCPAQMVVIHFAGYVPPNYNQKDIDSWKTILSKLREIQPSWKRLEESGEFYKNHQGDADRINGIIAIRISNIEVIVKKMEANQWLTNQERGYIDGDKKLYDEQESLATKLNSR